MENKGPPTSFIEALQRGTLPPIQQSQAPVVVATPQDEKNPSALGGLAALGATVLGATALGRKIPAVRNFFKAGPQPKSTFTMPNKPLGTGTTPTATGQSSELILSPSKELVVGKSQFGTALNNPLNFGEPLQKGGRIFGSATYDRALEAPFDKAPASQWIKWFQDANRGDLKYPGGPLQGTSRKVSPEELSDLNLVNFKDNKPVSGFLKTASDQGIEVDRTSLLNMIKSSPIQNIKTIRLTAGKDPLGDFADIREKVRISQNKIQSGKEDTTYQPLYANLNYMMQKAIRSDSAISAEQISDFQQRLKTLVKKHPETSEDMKQILVDFNKATGKYNASSAAPPTVQGKQDLRNYFPVNKSQKNYALEAGENFTEDVIYYDGPLTNVRSNAFRYVEGGPHYLKNSERELAFARYDDLPNPKLGLNKRHMRVSEVQSDLHSSQYSSQKDRVEDYFKNKIVPYNQNADLQLLQTQRKELLDKIAPYQELGRGSMGLTKSQQQEFAKLKYKINELDKNALGKMIRQGGIEATTAGPFSKSYNDMVVKNLLRSMAEKNVNAISIVPASMNQNIKMFNKSKFGNEMNYGLQDGKFIVPTKGESLYKKTNQYSSLNKSLDKIAKQYGAKFEQFPMPKSNPSKEFKVIEVIDTNNNKSYQEAIEQGRAHSNYTSDIDSRVVTFENHIAAANTQDEAQAILREYTAVGNPRGDLIVKRILPDSKENYEMVPTLIADDNILKKFLLPQKAYMYQGGLVDTVNIFKRIL